MFTPIGVLLGIASPSAYLGLMLSVHLLNPELSWIRYTISDLALGRFGWMDTTAECVFGLCALAVALGLYLNAGPGRGLKAATALLTAVGVSFFIVAVFRSSLSDAVTVQVVIHRGAVATIAVTFPGSCLFLLPILRRERMSRGLAACCAAAAAVSLMVVLVAILMPEPVQKTTAGLLEKVWVANSLVWFQLLGVWLFRIWTRQRRHELDAG